MRPVKIALCQLDILPDKEHNVRRAEELIEQAAARGADFAVLPEMFVCPFANENFLPASEEPLGPTIRRMQALAARFGMYVIAGSLPERENGAVYNTSYFIGRGGEVLARHRKMHLFDATLKDGTVYRESAAICPGSQVTVVQTEYGPVGLAICFDIRFSELFRLMGLRGVSMIFHPTAFNLSTGPAHYEISVRMRALDQQCFVASCEPARNLDCVYHSYANSMIAGPSGQILARMGLEEGVSVTEIDLDELDSARQVLPILSGRRSDLYDTVWKADLT